ncbi:16S rRNA (uracil(1498)-N(3))-methyltransferase [Massilia sp. DWR3-1-1]|uniref:16S rRNA (uracil(1498)-N(3))-methyltransferase n=1 Tax=Massilia sp. DWR3-1-1 TaxID=2804559 RepID=UPI003CE9B253
MPRFYCPQPLAAGATIDLPAAVAHHAWVVRLQPGTTLTLFNGEGGQFDAELLTLDKKGASARILAFTARECELPYPLTLVQALPEAGKMDWIIEKSVELGVAAIVPVLAQRSVVRLSGERAEKRHAHWQGIIVAAAEQSGRNRLPALAPLSQLREFTASAGGAQRILLSPRAQQPLAAWAAARAPQALTVLIGPEGGLTDEEEAAALEGGAIALGLGPRVLRTETAGLAVLATLAAIWGEH